MARVVMAYRETYPQNLEQLKSRTRVADKAHKVNNQRNSIASLQQRVARLQSLGSGTPFFAAMPEFNAQSSMADIARANQELDRLERKHLMTKQPMAQEPAAPAAPAAPGRPRLDAGKIRDANRAATGGISNILALKRAGKLTGEQARAQFKSAGEVRQDANVARPMAAAGPTAPVDSLLDKMKSAYGPTTRREGDSFRTTVPSESGPRGIDVSAPFVDRMEERTPGWSKLTPQQRAAQIYSMTGGKKLAPTESQTASGTVVADMRKGSADPGMKYLNSLSQVRSEQADARVNQKLDPTAPVDYSKVGDDYAQKEAQRRASAPPSTAGVPANASRAIVSDYGSGFATPGRLAQPTQAPAGTVMDLFTNTSSPSADALLSERRSGSGTNLTGPASSSGTANVVGNSIVNPVGGAQKPSAIPQATPSTPVVGAKSATGLPTVGGAIKVSPPAPQMTTSQAFQKMDEEGKKRKFAGFGNISWRN